MKKIFTLFVFGILCQLGFAQSDKFLTYESMIGRNVYFYAEQMASIYSGVAVYKFENGKYVALTSNTKTRSNGLYTSQDFQIFKQLNGYLHIDGIVVDRKKEMIKVTKDDNTYYLYYIENVNSNKFLYYIRNVDQWEEEVAVLNKNYNYYIESSYSEPNKAAEVKWSICGAPLKCDDEVFFIVQPVDGKSYVKSLSYYEVPFSFFQSDQGIFMCKGDALLREQMLQREYEQRDKLSRKGFVLVGRFQNKSIRLLEVRDSLSLFIGLEDDTNENINLRYLRVEPSRYPEFERKMSIVNEKYRNWAQIAKEDYITNFKKIIPVDFDNEAGYFTMGFSNCYTSTDLYAVFEVDNNGQSRLRIDNWQDYDSGNSSYESQMHRPYLYFNSPDDFSIFFELMKYENAVKKYEVVKAIADSANKAEREQDAKFN